MNYHIDMITHDTAFVEPKALMGQVNRMLIKFHLLETNHSCRARTWMAHLTDGDANHYANFLPFVDEQLLIINTHKNKDVAKMMW